MTTMYTFALEYQVPSAPDDSDVWYEEIDVHADSREAALAEVTRQAQEDYQPGYRRIVELPAGGSGGLVQIWSLG
jgi:hypothetical protein